ncbi:MAG: hypothetical protein QOI57_3072 [Rubrobacteraceae bacterium]|jgi:hypothetical protein|nr:hypothetical protein [Rubrobacteraceae bacterium]
MATKKNPGKEDLWRSRRVMELYAIGEPIFQISRLVGWSEGRVRKVLREAGVIVTDQDRDGSREE